MSNILDFASLLEAGGRLRRTRVASVEGGIRVDIESDRTGSTAPVLCDVLQTGVGALELNVGDAVLVWTDDGPDTRGIVLGRIVDSTAPVSPSPAAHGASTSRLVIEGDQDVVLKNRNAKIVLGADGDIEIVCSSLTSRSQRLLRLLAPLIKLN